MQDGAGVGDGSSGALRRVLGPVAATCIVVGAIIGVGIFFNPSRVTQMAGSGDRALLAWAVAGAIALLGALTCAELGGMYRRSGAQYAILRDAYGPLPAFLFVFCNATAIQAGASAVIAIVCVHHAAAAVAGAEAAARIDPAVTTALAGALIVLLACVNVLGVRSGAGVQVVTVVARVAALLVVTAIAVVVGGRAEDVAAAATGADGGAVGEQERGALAAICAALVPAFFAFGGWQHALWIGGEVRDPQRNVPRAIVIGVLIVVAAYLLVNWAYLHLLGERGVMESDALAADAVARAWPGTGSRLAAGAVALSALGVLNAQLLSGPRLVFGMARDGRFFRVFAKVHPRFATPVAAIALIAAMSIAMLVLGGETARDRIVTGVVFVDAVFFAMTGLALVVLRVRRPDAERPVRVPAYPIVPILFAIGELGVVAGATLDPDVRTAWLVGVAWIAAGAILWAIFFRAGAGGGDRPRCAACRYDLAGTPQPWTVCSECGADLTRPGAVVVGERRLGRQLAILGAVVAVAGVLAILASRYDWNRVLPSSWLIEEVRREERVTRANDGAVSTTATWQPSGPRQELLRRLNAGTLDDRHVRRIIELAMNENGDPDTRRANWIEFIADFHGKGLIDDLQLAQYIRAAWAWRYFDGAGYSGQQLWYQYGLRSPAPGTLLPLTLHVRVHHARVDGESFPLPVLQGNALSLPVASHLLNALSWANEAERSAFRGVIDRPGLAAGEHSLSIVVGFRIVRTDELLAGSGSVPEPILTWTEELSTTFTVP